MATSGTITPSENASTTMTKAQLEAALALTISASAEFEGSDLTSPVDVDVDVDVVTKQVSANAISAPSLSAPTEVSYDSVSTTDEVTNETLNRTAESLKDSINTNLGAWAATITTKLGDLATATGNGLTDMQNDVNAELLKFNGEINDLIGDINVAFELIRQKEIEQNDSIALAINTVAGDMYSNDQALQTAIQALNAKIQGLDDVYSTDADFAARVAQVNDFIETLRGTDLGFVDAVDSTIDELNGLTRIVSKEISVSSGSGTHSFVNSANGVPTFASGSYYDVDAMVIGNAKVSVDIENKTGTGFTLKLSSRGVHFVPQPHDASVTAVKVLVRVTHAKINPMTLGVDVLKNSWVTDGSGTDVKNMGA